MPKAPFRRDVGIAERAVLRQAAVPSPTVSSTPLQFRLQRRYRRACSSRRCEQGEPQHAMVPAEIMKWVRVGGRKLKGLVRRREAEARPYVENPSFFRASFTTGDTGGAIADYLHHVLRVARAIVLVRNDAALRQLEAGFGAAARLGIETTSQSFDTVSEPEGAAEWAAAQQGRRRSFSR